MRQNIRRTLTTAAGIAGVGALAIAAPVSVGAHALGSSAQAAGPVLTSSSNDSGSDDSDSSDSDSGAAPSGGVATGAGGTAGSDSALATALPLGLLGAAAVGGTAVLVRRRAKADA